MSDKPKLSIYETIEEMKNLGDTLVPYNWPQNNPRLEGDLNLIKTRQIEFEGYSIIVHFSRADHDSTYVETLQIFGSKVPFLPFDMVVRLGKLFLGSAHLSLVEFIKENRKIYCWTVTLDKEGRPIPAVNAPRTESCLYDNWRYEYLYPHQVNFY